MLNFTFDASGKYDIVFQERFVVNWKGEMQTVGEFLPYFEYDYERSLLEQDPTIEILELEAPYKKSVFWKDGEKEFNIMFVVDNTKTCILMRNGISEESARECFRRLTVKSN